MPPEILGDAELMELLLRALGADFAIVDTYTMPVRLHSGRAQLCLYASTPGEHTASTLSNQMFNGDHFFIRT
jgi:surfactin synthase thioesterase subunit